MFADGIVGKVRTPAIPYVLGGRSDKGTDCINLIAWVMGELGGRQVPRGSNDAWRNSMAWTGTLAEASAKGRLMPGAILYIDYHKPPGGSGGTPGAMDHAGVYVGGGYGLKTPDGRPGTVVHASQSRGGVYPSTLQNAWTHAAWLQGVAYEVKSEELQVKSGGTGLTETNHNSSLFTFHSSLPSPGQARVITSTSGLYLREGPSVRSKRVKQLPAGTIVDVLRVEAGWAHVRWDVRPGLYHMGWCCAGANGVDYLEFGGGGDHD